MRFLSDARRNLDLALRRDAARGSGQSQSTTQGADANGVENVFIDTGTVAAVARPRAAPASTWARAGATARPPSLAWDGAFHPRCQPSRGARRAAVSAPGPGAGRRLA